MTSYARERLTIELYRKYERSDQEEIQKWEAAIGKSDCSSAWYTHLETIPFSKNLLIRQSRKTEFTR